jgi:integrase
MASGKITKRSVDALDVTGRTEFLWDDELSGFGIRMTSSGAKSYIYQYRTGGREAAKRRYTIGKHGSPWTPKTARDEAERLALLVGQGIDPATADSERRRQAVELAFSSYVTTFVDGYLKSRWKDWKLGKSMLERQAVPILKSKPLPLIKRSDVVAILDPLLDRPAVARLMHATLRKLFKWAVSRGDIERSPIENMEAPAIPAARDRVLRDDELAIVWEAAGALGWPFGPIYHLLIGTGQRREEVAAMSWEELDRATVTWTLPAGRAKNGQTHIVPLNTGAVSTIDAVARALSKAGDGEEVKWPTRGLVFTTTGKTAVSGHSRAKARLDDNITTILKKHSADGRSSPVFSAWRVHDLRRTVATGLQRLGIRFEVTEAVLNHVSGSKSGVAGVYQRHDWADEKRSALDAWGRHIDALVRPADSTNVVALPLAQAS